MHKNSQKSFKSLQRMILAILFGSLLAACTAQVQTAPPETEEPLSGQDLTPTNTSTPRATSTPTPSPLGSPINPITMGFILKPEDSLAIEAAEDVAFLITDQTGYEVESLIYPDFSSYALAAQNGEIHLLWLSPFEYLYLHDLGSADAFIMTNHLGVYAYGVQFLANAFRGFTSYYDPQENESVGTALQALQQFAGTRPCFINDESIPGFFVPLGLLSNTSTPTLEPVFTYRYSAIIRALYIQGICDFGATYALTGDPRSASDVLQDLPEARELVIVIWQSDGIIPNTGLSSSPGLPENIQFQLKEAILGLQNHPEGLSLLSLALNYDVEALKSINNSFYDPFREIIAPLYLDLDTITQD
jgi:phosphonate transport system substrate-binding protein